MHTQKKNASPENDSSHVFVVHFFHFLNNKQNPMGGHSCWIIGRATTHTHPIAHPPTHISTYPPTHRSSNRASDTFVMPQGGPWLLAYFAGARSVPVAHVLAKDPSAVFVVTSLTGMEDFRTCSLCNRRDSSWNSDDSLSVFVMTHSRVVRDYSVRGNWAFAVPILCIGDIVSKQQMLTY